MLVAFVILHLTVWDADTGKMLEQRTVESPSTFSISGGSKIEDCRIVGVETAKKLTAKYRKTYPNAFTNVDCEWHRGQAL